MYTIFEYLWDQDNYKATILEVSKEVEVSLIPLTCVIPGNSLVVKCLGVMEEKALPLPERLQIVRLSLLLELRR